MNGKAIRLIGLISGSVFVAAVVIVVVCGAEWNDRIQAEIDISGCVARSYSEARIKVGTRLSFAEIQELPKCWDEAELHKKYRPEVEIVREDEDGVWMVVTLRGLFTTHHRSGGRVLDYPRKWKYTPQVEPHRPGLSNRTKRPK